MGCEYCRSNPHNIRCPESPERNLIHYCDECKLGIFEGDIFYTVDGKKYCLDCMEECKSYAEHDELFWDNN